MSDEQHFYGGQAIIEGVMMRGKDTWAAAVRRQDDTVVVTRQPVGGFSQTHAWARWPIVRGNFALVEALSLGISSLMYSFNVLVEEETERANAEAEAKHVAEAEPEATAEADTAETKPDSAEEPGSAGSGDAQVKKPPKKPPKKQETSGWLVWLSLIPAFALGIGLFILLPAWVPDWLHADSMGSAAKNGIEAVTQLEESQPDIVVTDMQMPEMNGLELVEHVRARHPLVPVILMTAHSARYATEIPPRTDTTGIHDPRTA